MKTTMMKKIKMEINPYRETLAEMFQDKRLNPVVTAWSRQRESRLGTTSHNGRRKWWELSNVRGRTGRRSIRRREEEAPNYAEVGGPEANKPARSCDRLTSADRCRLSSTSCASSFRWHRASTTGFKPARSFDGIIDIRMIWAKRMMMFAVFLL